VLHRLVEPTPKSGHSWAIYEYTPLDDDLPLSEAVEELADDDIASNVATLIAGELSRNRYGRNQVAVSVFNEGGIVIHKIWTRSEYDVGRVE
jgi:hypothetical protein